MKFITITTLGIFLLSCFVVFAGKPLPPTDRTTWTKEVLYGIETTPEKLILTVVSGGCTEKEHFHIDVNKGATGQPPYLLTVYRTVPDECKKKPELVKLSYPRKDLGLEGVVDFTLLNRIGNTSQHRLLP